MKRKLAFVVQRYGLEVNGGAELLSRQLVEHLQQQYDIEVLTTKAIEYTTWKNEYTNDVDVINGVTVRRFGVDKPRDLNRFGKFSGKVIGNPEHTMEQEEQWFEMQGPHVPELIDYIKDHADDYEAFIFMTYLYYTTVKGLPLVKDKAILISTAHDEPPIYLKTFDTLFQMPKALFYLTVEEKKFVERNSAMSALSTMTATAEAAWKCRIRLIHSSVKINTVLTITWFMPEELMKRRAVRNYLTISCAIKRKIRTI